jgi:hypothetical protein
VFLSGLCGEDFDFVSFGKAWASGGIKPENFHESISSVFLRGLCGEDFDVVPSGLPSPTWDYPDPFTVLTRSLEP